MGNTVNRNQTDEFKQKQEETKAAGSNSTGDTKGQQAGSPNTSAQQAGASSSGNETQAQAGT